jgi:hypothetical protein
MKSPIDSHTVYEQGGEAQSRASSPLQSKKPICAMCKAGGKGWLCMTHAIQYIDTYRK